MLRGREENQRVSVSTAEVLRPNEVIHAPSKLACFTLPGMSPRLIPLRPSNEVLFLSYPSL